MWKDAERTQPVLSEQTEFPTDADTTIYVEGTAPTTTDYLVFTQQLKTGNSWVDGDSVSTIVVQAEIPVVIRAFIPHKWTEGETSLPAPLGSCVVEGDRQGFSLKGYLDSEEPKYRMAQTTVLTPFKELHSDLDISNERKDKAAPASQYYDKATKVPASDENLKFGESFVAGATFDHAYTPQITDRRYKDGSRYQDDGHPVSAQTIVCSGEPGMPAYIPSAVIPNIDWKFIVKIDTRYPNSLRAKVEAEHNLYPSYEVIVGNYDGTYSALWNFKPDPSTLPGPWSLNNTVTGTGNDVGLK